MFLEEITAHTRVVLARRKKDVPLPGLKKQAGERARPLKLSAALTWNGVRLICEVKKASPSRGIICPVFNPAVAARRYAAGGAAAISILTEERWFQGSLEHLRAVRETLGSRLPVLRKDFILDPYQVYEARAYGADALLLIVAILTPRELKNLLAISHELGMECLVEAHDEAEVETAVASEAKIIGVNNRDLKTFQVDLSVTWRLLPLIPPDRVVVAESGIRTRADVLRMQALGVDAVLVGEALMGAPDVTAKLKELNGQG